MPSPLPHDHDDQEVVAALRAGDRTAFQELVEALNPALTRTARTYVSDAIADEVVQETWMSVIRSIDTFEGRSALKTWIYRIMLNKVRTVASREAKIVPFTSLGPRSGGDAPSVDPDRLNHGDLGQGYWPEAPPRWDDLPAERFQNNEVSAMIATAISELPPTQREVVSLRDVEGWTSSEVCNALGISSVNERVLLHRGRAALRHTLEEHLK